MVDLEQLNLGVEGIGNVFVGRVLDLAEADEAVSLVVGTGSKRRVILAVLRVGQQAVVVRLVLLQGQQLSPSARLVFAIDHADVLVVWLLDIPVEVLILEKVIAWLIFTHMLIAAERVNVEASHPRRVSLSIHRELRRHFLHSGHVVDGLDLGPVFFSLHLSCSHFEIIDRV